MPETLSWSEPHVVDINAPVIDWQGAPEGKPSFPPSGETEVLSYKLLKACSEYLTGDNAKYVPLIAQTIAYAQYRHAYFVPERKRMRADGKTQYIVHPLKVAQKLADMRQDAVTILSAIIHDVPEDTYEEGNGGTRQFKDDINDLFGPDFRSEAREVVNTVGFLTKINSSKNLSLAEVKTISNIYKSLKYAPRAILIKFADRLHNMETLNFLNDPEKRKSTASQTLRYYVPLARALGMREWANKLEEMAVNTLSPDDWTNVKSILEEAYSEKNRQDVALSYLSLFGKQAAGSVLLFDDITCIVLPPPYREIINIEEDRFVVADPQTFRVFYIFNNKQSLFEGEVKLQALTGGNFEIFPDQETERTGVRARGKRLGVAGRPDYKADVYLFDRQGFLRREACLADIFRINGSSEEDNQKKQFALEKAEKLVDFYEEQKRKGGGALEFVPRFTEGIRSPLVRVRTPVGQEREVPAYFSLIDYSYYLSEKIGRRFVGVRVNGEETGDLSYRIRQGDLVEVILSENEDFNHFNPGYLDLVKSEYARKIILKDITRLVSYYRQLTGLKIIDYEMSNSPRARARRRFLSENGLIDGKTEGSFRSLEETGKEVYEQLVLRGQDKVCRYFSSQLNQPTAGYQSPLLGLEYYWSGTLSFHNRYQNLDDFLVDVGLGEALVRFKEFIEHIQETEKSRVRSIDLILPDVPGMDSRFSAFLSVLGINKLQQPVIREPAGVPRGLARVSYLVDLHTANGRLGEIVAFLNYLSEEACQTYGGRIKVENREGFFELYGAHSFSLSSYHLTAELVSAVAGVFGCNLTDYKETGLSTFRVKINRPDASNPNVFIHVQDALSRLIEIMEEGR